MAYAAAAPAPSTAELEQHMYHATEGVFEPRKERPRASPPVAGRATIICPTMDERALFHAQLYGCFAAQRWADKELVVIDTGEHPSPFLALKALEDPRLVYRHYRTMGTAWSVGLKRNLAVHLASGEMIVHFDDDDLYAPIYLETVLGTMGSADAVTLACWFVCDACTGRVAFVSPENDGSQEAWVYGYGFSNAYRREVCVQHPYTDSHFAEDYNFLVAVRDAPGGRGVRLHRDEEGVVLHMQTGMNLSNSHAHSEVSFDDLQWMPVAQLPGFGRFLEICRSQVGTAGSSSFVSVGETYQMYLRPTPHQREGDMRRVLRSLGVAPPPRSAAVDWREAELDDDDVALASCRIGRLGELFVEPGRAFWAVKRFSDVTLLPGDVPRVTPSERVALLHLARMLLRRCPPRLTPAESCEGWLRLQMQTLSHIAVVNLLAQVVRYFPRVRLEVSFDWAGEILDPGAAQREMMLQLLAERGL